MSWFPSRSATRRASSSALTAALVFSFTAIEAVAFTAAEREAVLSHGPWPPPARRDPSNRVSGKPEAIEFGERLFFSPGLSGTGGVLCASCHEPWRGHADGRPRALGIAPADRNTQSIVNVRLQRWFGWDGANDNLWAQSIRPLLEPREMRSSAADVAAAVRGDTGLAGLYAKAFAGPLPAADEALLVDVGKALAAYQETLVSGRTPFDDFRDALARGDASAAARYPAQARQGLRIFIAKGDCARCHAGPAFSDGSFHRGGIESKLEDGTPDPGRQGGIRKLLSSRYNLLGSYSDDPARASAGGTRAAAGERDVAGAFRTPGLRDVTLTAPYMHDGSLANLCEVLLRHPGGGASFTPDESRDLLAFLESLTAAGPARFPGENSPACRDSRVTIRP